MSETLQKPNVPMLTEVERKELADRTAKKLSTNLNDAVEKSIVKKSADEAQAKPS